MQNHPKISIITPMYNSENTIMKTVHSIVNQKTRNWEYIPVAKRFGWLIHNDYF